MNLGRTKNGKRNLFGGSGLGKKSVRAQGEGCMKQKCTFILRFRIFSSFGVGVGIANMSAESSVFCTPSLTDQVLKLILKYIYSFIQKLKVSRSFFNDCVSTSKRATAFCFSQSFREKIQFR